MAVRLGLSVLRQKVEATTLLIDDAAQTALRRAIRDIVQETEPAVSELVNGETAYWFKESANQLHLIRRLGATVFKVELT